MVTMEEIQAAYYMVAATGVLVAAAYYIMNMRASRRSQELAQKTQQQNLETRQAQLFMQIYAKWADEGFSQKWLNSFSERYTDFSDFKSKVIDKPDRYLTMFMFARFFEGLGVLVEAGLLDIRLIALTMCSDTKIIWDQLGPIMGEWRRYTKVPRMFDKTEYLYNALMKYVELHPELKP
jgi:hypothetical protein